jgi:hypothetical protein
MATQTVVCPECGSPTAPGRYTCNECGAFLDGVAVTPRSWEPEPAADESETAHPGATPSGLMAEAQPIEPQYPDGVSAALATESLPPAGDTLLEDGPWLDPVDPALPPPPDVLHDVQWPSPDDRLPLAYASAEPALADGPAAGPRVPAGAWLPPSAPLTSLDDAAPDTGSGAVAGAVAVAASSSGRDPAVRRDWLAAFGPAEGRWAAARRTIAIGSAVTIIGFVLPWAGGSLSSILAVWTSVWGLAGAGHWLILLTVAALGVVAGSSGRTATIPLGLPAIAVASFLLGLIWPSLLGSGGRAIGILVILVGVVVIAAGGVLHLSARHEAAMPDV